MICVHDLAFEYPGTRALDGVSFTVEPGTITALVGPNGAGKTTLLRCLAGLERPLTGGVVIDGVDVVANPRDAHRHLGFLQDFFGLYEDLPVRRCLLFHAAALGVAPSARPDRVAAVAEALGLADRLNQRAGALSRGLRQRLAIAQAIIHRPRVLLLDEPSAGLDPDARHELARLLRRLATEGMTLLVSSHILAELDDYSTHMLILEAGHLLDHCPVRPVAGQPCRLRVSLVGTSPDHIQSQLLPRLAAWPGIAAIAPDADGAAFDGPGEPAAQAALLRDLVSSGLAVHRFTIESRSMQDVYSARHNGRGDSARL